MKRTPLAERELPGYTRGEEIFNMVSHIVGGALGIAATALCVVMAAIHRNVMGVVSGAVYGATLILLYTMSSIYHGLSPRLTAKKVFQVIDHCTVYLLIAGSYTPFALVSLRAQNTALGWTIFGLVWGIAAVGIVFTAIDLKSFRIPSMVCYLVMGWLILIAALPIVRAVGLGGSILLVTGGLCYTAGAVLYLNGRRRRYVHSVFHLFVLAGSILHFLCILFYVM
ncbi:MAG: hemolysin III family protein [Clostridia bacterium]|nr:hemolysin III family protein [Clostridia bacterium]